MSKMVIRKRDSARARAAKARRRKMAKGTAVTPAKIRPDTAGIDIGATEILVAVQADRDEEPVRSFETFTADLYEIADWLEKCGVSSVAMESTGVYWIALYQILEERHIEVCLVNARHFKNVPGRKTDVLDCQWLQYLHSVGLLRASFRPSQEICAVRTLLRYRQSHIQMAAEHVQHMQKSMEQMNLKLQHVISDITGVTGMRIIQAILAGERDARALAELRDTRIRASEETIVKSLEGDYRREHLITLKQSLEGYQFCQKQMADLDQKLETFMAELPAKLDLGEHPLPPSPKRLKRQHNAPVYDQRQYCYRAFGVDVTGIPGFAGPTAQVLLTEVGPELSKFRSAGAFASWLTLCPDNDISGGKILRTKTRQGKNRAALALRLAAQALEDDQHHIGQFFRRMKAKLGRAQAITAVAHKLARIFYTMVTKQQPYDESAFAKADARNRERKQAKLHKQAKEFGYRLVPLEAAMA